jgi:PAS domain S-box
MEATSEAYNDQRKKNTFHAADMPGRNYGYSLDRIKYLVHSTLDFDELMNRIILEASIALNSETAMITLRQQDKWVVKYVYGFSAKHIGRCMTDNQVKHAVLAVKTRKPVIVKNVLNDEMVEREQMLKWGIHSMIVVPLINEQQVIGVIFFNYHKYKCVFDDTLTEFIESLASSITLALQNVKQYEKVCVELYEYMKAIRVIRQQNELLKRQADLLNLSNDAIFSSELNGPILYWNRGAEKIYGFSMEEALGKTSFELLKTRYPDGIEKIHDTLDKEGIWKGELEHTCKNGRQIFVESSKQVIINELGQQVILETNRDITHRKLTEKMINRKKIILDSINCIYGKAIKYNNVKELGQSCLGILEKITGSKCSFISGINHDGILYNVATSAPGCCFGGMPDYSLSKYRSESPKLRGLYGNVILMGKSIMTNEPDLHEDSIGAPDGHPNIESFIGVPFVRDNRVIGMIGVANREGGYGGEQLEILEAVTPTVMEIILCKRTEEEQRRSEKQYKLLFDTMFQGVVYQDGNGRIISMNPAAGRILGKSPEKFLGSSSINEENYTIKEDGSIFHGIEHPAMISLETGQEIQDVTMGVYNPRDKQYRWISVNAVPLFKSGEKKPYQVYSIFTDITERITSKKLIVDQNTKLLEAEMEKNAVLKNTIEMKDEFLSLISHEFKTPLTVINSALQAMDLLCKNDLSEKTHGFLRKIKQNSNRQLRLVNNLLEITRMNAGIIKLNKANLDIVNLTRSITESIRIFAEQKGIKLKFNSSLKMKIIGIDEGKYEKILLNLLSNAVKFTPRDRTVEVKVCQKIINRKRKVCIQVIDNGVGIPDDKKQLIFERFGQVDSSLTRQAEGTGIGLHLVKLLVDHLGGEISLDSKPGIGSTFTVLLPIEKTNEIILDKNTKEISDNRLIQASTIEFSDIYL